MFPKKLFQLVPNAATEVAMDCLFFRIISAVLMRVVTRSAIDLFALVSGYGPERVRLAKKR